MRRAILQIVIADISMSLDNVLGVAGAARGHIDVLIIGLLLSVGLMGAAAGLIARLLQRHRWISYLGLVIVLYVALSMIWAGSRTVWLARFSLFSEAIAVASSLFLKARIGAPFGILLFDFADFQAQRKYVHASSQCYASIITAVIELIARYPSLAREAPTLPGGAARRFFRHARRLAHQDRTAMRPLLTLAARRASNT